MRQACNSTRDKSETVVIAFNSPERWPEQNSQVRRYGGGRSILIIAQAAK